MKVYRTREDAFLLITFINEDKQDVVFLIDPWKVGIRDFNQFDGGLNQLRQELRLPDLEFHEISQDEGYKWINRGYQISDKVGTDLSAETMKWLETKNITDMTVDGSLFKCFNCEEGNLTSEEVKEILQVARKEVRRGIAGTDREEQYFYICEKCKGEMHDAHT